MVKSPADVLLPKDGWLFDGRFLQVGGGLHSLICCASIGDEIFLKVQFGASSCLLEL
jgi:hypothetical protein